MVTMILKMSGMTILYIVLTLLLKKWLKDRKLTIGLKILVGVIFGICSVLSTHFGVDYNHMMVNVRDIGPLAGGFFFSPLSGIIAGLIGGVERFIAGTFWNVGAYTTVACSVSTALAGFLAAFLHIFLFKRQSPKALYAFFMGCVMEVFHMYAIFVTHRDDMSMAFYVVKNCSVPMIVFTGLGVGLSSLLLDAFSRKLSLKNFMKLERRSLSQRFQAWLFLITIIVTTGSFLFTFSMQTYSANQNARKMLQNASSYIKEAYADVEAMEINIDMLAMEQAKKSVLAISDFLEHSGNIPVSDQEVLDRLRQIHKPLVIAVTDEKGEVVSSTGNSPLYTSLFDKVLSNELELEVLMPSYSRIAAAVYTEHGMVEVVFAREQIEDYLDVAQLGDTLSKYNFGNEGTYDIIRESGYIEIGTHSVTILTGDDRKEFQKRSGEGGFFESDMFGTAALCLLEPLNMMEFIFLRLPLSEVYAERDIQAYENALASILLFAAIYVLISLMVQKMVIDKLQTVNEVLGRITDGDLNEEVSVRNSIEFASLSDDINQTVTALKGYINAAERRMEQELELAKAIQKSALVQNFSFPRTDFEIFALMDPAKMVGGDFYDLFFVENNRLALVIADVSGKGIPASLFMMQSKVAIRSLAETGNSPAEILYKANNMLCSGNETEMFVTAWVGIIDLETGLMKCANAGHEYPAIMRKGGDFELFKDPHGLVLAAMENVRYKEYEISLSPGDRLFVYTDGVPEAINENEEQYGTDRMILELNAMKELSVEELLIDERKNIQVFSGKAEQFDDITMLGFWYYGNQKS